MPTIEQIKAARALLGWSQGDLAKAAGLSQTGIGRIENGENRPNAETTSKIITSFDHAGIEFLPDGVRKRGVDIHTYYGPEGFRSFLDDIYNTALTVGGEICLFNAVPSNWIKWLGQEFYDMQSERMNKIKDKFTFKITAKKDERNLISSSFAEYRWFSEEMYSEKAMYAYGDKVAFLMFEPDNVKIVVLRQKEYADALRVLFNIAWEKVAVKVSEK